VVSRGDGDRDDGEEDALCVVVAGEDEVE
jgi:hypothetical protein